MPLSKINIWRTVLKHYIRSMENSYDIIERLKPYIPDISNVYTDEQLQMFNEAIFGEAEIRKPKSQPMILRQKKSEPIDISKLSRSKIRLNILDNEHYVKSIKDYFDEIENCFVKVIKTGVSIKHQHTNYANNIINYNELRLVDGVLVGNLYFNVIRNEEDFAELSIEKEINWFRGFVMLKKISVHELFEYITKDNIDFLKSLSRRSNKRRLTNTEKLVRKHT